MGKGDYLERRARARELRRGGGNLPPERNMSGGGALRPFLPSALSLDLLRMKVATGDRWKKEFEKNAASMVPLPPSSMKKHFNLIPRSAGRVHFYRGDPCGHGLDFVDSTYEVTFSCNFIL